MENSLHLQENSNQQNAFCKTSELESSAAVSPTHAFITERAFEILRNDMGSEVYDLFGLHKTTVIEFSMRPDIDEKDSGIYLGHFYNPYYEVNYFGKVSPTAHERFIAHFAEAISKKSFESLGRALHYLQDCCEPHHAANSANIIDGFDHMEYECWVDKLRPQYSDPALQLLVSHSNMYMYALSKDEVQISRDCAWYGYYVFSLFLDTTIKMNFTWVKATKLALTYAQKISAAVMYRFLWLSHLIESTPLNLAASHNAITKQSSTEYGGVSSLAVDCSTEGNFTHHYTATHTGKKTNPWWEVDLGAMYNISKITVLIPITEFISIKSIGGYWIKVLNENEQVVWSRCSNDKPGYTKKGYVFPYEEYPIMHSSVKGCKVRIEVYGNNVDLSLAEVEVYSPNNGNIALQKIATQSATYDGAIASYAVDGRPNPKIAEVDNYDGNFDPKITVTRTKFEDKPWWQIDLRSNNYIDAIEIFNQENDKENLHDYTVSILDENSKIIWQCLQESYPNPKVKLNVPRVCGRYVKIQLNRLGYLSLAQVKVLHKDQSENNSDE